MNERTHRPSPALAASRRVGVRTTLVCLAVTGVLLSGCSAPSLSVPELSGARSQGAVAPAAAPADGGAASDRATPGEAGSLATGVERQVVRTASLTLVVPDVLAGADRARSLADGLDGWVASESLAVGAQRGPSTVVLSVPASRLSDAVLRAGELGTIAHRGTTADDVTDTLVDLDARRRVLEASIARIEALMARAGSVTEIAQVERELSQRQAELESLRAKQQRLEGKVERATLTLTLQTPAESVAVHPVLHGLQGGLDAFLASVVLVLTVVGALLPWAVLGALALVGVRWLRRRRTPPASGLGRVDVAPGQPQGAPREGGREEQAQDGPQQAVDDEDQRHGGERGDQVEQ